MERKTIIDGKEVVQYLERVDREHGYVIVTRVPSGDGVSYHVHRAFSGWGNERWTQSRDKNGELIYDKAGKPVMELQVPTQQDIDRQYAKARAQFDGMTKEEIADRCAKAPLVSGRKVSI